MSSKNKATDWSSGSEALIKQSLLVGNLTAAVELCFKSGKMAEERPKTVLFKALFISF